MTAKRLLRTQIITSLLCSMLIICAVVLSLQAGLFTGPDNFLYDLYFKWRGPQAASGQVVLVLMDEASAAELSRRKGNWSRRHMAQALENLCKSGAEVIGLDMIYSAPDMDAEADGQLAYAINQCNNIVMARVSAARGVDEIAPLPIFQAGMIGDGFIDLPLDDDDILRKLRFFTAKSQGDGVQLLPAFALEIARTYYNLDYNIDFAESDYFRLGAARQRQLRLPNPELLINFTGNHNIFTNISFAEAVKGRFAPEKVRGKIVLIGSTLASQKDFFTTPFTRFQAAAEDFSKKFARVEKGVLGDQDPGVACHAHAVETILSQRYITKVREGRLIALMVLLGLIGLVFYVPRLGMTWEVGLFIGGVLLIIGGGYISFLGKRLWLPTAPLMLLFVGQFVGGMVIQKSFDKRKTALVTSLFGKYVSAGVVGELIKGDITDTLEGRRQNLTMLFSDLRSFTTLSEKLGAKDTSQLLNIYFDRMIPIVFAHQGTLDKLMGDAVMAFFGAPLPLAEHPIKAAETALAMLESLRELQASGIPGAEKLKIGIGLNTGVVTVGNLGSTAFMDYTIIGDDVNLASRLEGINKVYGTTIIVSQFTRSELGTRFITRELDIVKVKGKEKAVTIYELVGYSDKVDAAELARIDLFEDGLAAYRRQDWQKAEACFSQVAADGDDAVARLYIDRVKDLQAKPPAPGWDGVTVFDHK